MNREEALSLLREHIKNENLVKHHIAVEIVMRDFAEYYDEDQDKWGLAGLLHDIDWEKTQKNPEQHSLLGEKILLEAGVEAEVAKAVKVHNHLHRLPLETKLEKTLFCVDELTGLIIATALVQPDKKLANVTPESVIKKFNSPAFAKGVDRKVIGRCEELMELSLEKVVRRTLSAMQQEHNQLGL